MSRHGPDAQDLRLLAELLEVGVPLIDALGTIARSAGAGRRRARISAAADHVARGGRVAEALGGGGAHVTALLAAGERIGRLAQAAVAAADLEERLAAVRHRVVASLAYPTLVLAVAVAVIGVVMTTVVPRMVATYAELGGELPWITRAVVLTARTASRPGPPLVLLAVLVGAVVARRATNGDLPALQPSGWPPLPGRLRRSLEIAVAARVTATLLGHGVPLADAVDAAATGSSHADVRGAFARTATMVRCGEDRAIARGLSALLDGADLAILGVGEERGLLPVQFARVADRRLRSLEQRLEMVGALAEPVLVLVVGGIVGAIVAALYLPSFRVLELL